MNCHDQSMTQSELHSKQNDGHTLQAGGAHELGTSTTIRTALIFAISFDSGDVLTPYGTIQIVVTN